MPFLKSISGHNSCRNVFKYLYYDEAGNRRDLATDQIGPTFEKEWWREFDNMRKSHRKFGITPRSGGKSREYYHFILSPDANDDADLDTIREVACEWVAANFPETFQVAIVYHDDSHERIENGEDGILHAHVVVNSVDSLTGRKLHIDDAQVDELADSLQEIARDFGLSAYDNTDRSYKRKFARQSAKNVTKNEERMAKRGEKTFKEELRKILDEEIPKNVSIEQLSAKLAPFGYGIERTHDDLIFLLPDQKKIRASALGLAYREEEMSKRFMKHSFVLINSRSYPSFADRYKATAEAMQDVDEKIAEIESLLETHHVIKREGITSLADFEKRIEELRDFGKETRTELYIANKRVKGLNEVNDAIRVVKTSKEHPEKVSEDDLLEAYEALDRAGFDLADPSSWYSEYDVEGETLMSLQSTVDGTSRRIEELERARFNAYAVLHGAEKAEERERERNGMPKGKSVDVHIKAPRRPRTYASANSAPYWKLQIKKDKYKEISATSRAYRAALLVRQKELDPAAKLLPYATRQEQIAKSIEAETHRQRTLEKPGRTANCELQ